MQSKLKEKYIPHHYQIRLFDQYNAVRQGSSSVADYITQFDDIRLRCGVHERPNTIITRFNEGLRPEIQGEVHPYYIITLDQVYRVAQDMEICFRLDPRCDDDKSRVPIGGQPSTPGPNTSRSDPTP